MIVGNRFVAPLPWESWGRDLPPALASAGVLWVRDLPPALIVPLVIGLGVSLCAHGRISRFPVSPMLATLAWCAAALVAQRVAPFARVWLPLLPLALIAAVGGLAGLISARFRWERAAPIVAFGLALVLAIHLVGIRGAQPFDDAALEPDAEAITLYLKGAIGEGEAAAVMPSSPPLVYYFRRHNLPISLLTVDFSAVRAERVYVVVLKRLFTIETLLHLLRGYGLDTAAYRPPLLLANFPATALYRLERAG
jgi:hypothetical protein